MVINLVLLILGVVLAIGILLEITREDWFSTYLTIIATVITFPIVASFRVVAIAFMLIQLFWKLSILFLKSIAKAVLFGIAGIVLSVIIGVSYFVPHIGGRVLWVEKRLRRTIDISRLVDECRFTRDMMIEIVAEQDTRFYKYESEDRYRKGLKEVKEVGEKKLSLGESALSLFVGGVLLVSQVHQVQLLQTGFYGFAIVHVIEAGLLIIAISIIYRASILEFLTYSGDEEFSSLAELDVALSYQKAISRVGIIQLLTFMIVLGMRFSSANRERISSVLNLYYGDKTFLESMRFAWREIRREDSG